ncbi:hypothetical protein [Treponema sp.]
MSIHLQVGTMPVFIRAREPNALRRAEHIAFLTGRCLNESDFH